MHFDHCPISHLRREAQHTGPHDFCRQYHTVHHDTGTATPGRRDTGFHGQAAIRNLVGQIRKTDPEAFRVTLTTRLLDPRVPSHKVITERFFGHRAPDRVTSLGQDRFKALPELGLGAVLVGMNGCLQRTMAVVDEPALQWHVPGEYSGKDRRHYRRAGSSDRAAEFD